ncbi:hypothetical protein HPB48_020554 [Haemaphysalis longicornis]|uniref:Uncharacterized protein n=1 Tax=Haemaphysalis longicornis TaxID=44386 RepID=A0A9J6FWJ6_HAELO|nr:hypothetical protein HPB48_020554 [Haemaphysalis longicornis]
MNVLKSTIESTCFIREEKGDRGALASAASRFLRRNPTLSLVAVLFQPETTPVPALPVVNRHGYTGLSTITQNALDINYGNLRKRPKTEEE